MRKLVTYGLLVGSTLLLAACSSKGSSEKQANKTLNVTLPMEPSTADPNKATDTYSGSMISQTLEGLYDVTNQGKVVPGVATKIVKPTNNRTTYVFNLRKNAKWQNGDPVTAQDFVTSFDRQADPKTKSQYASHFQDFKNFAAIQKGKAKPSSLGVKALGKYKLKVELNAPDPTFNFKAASQFYPLNTSAVKKFGQSYGTSASKTVSNGPYVLTTWDPSKDAWYYKKNKQYWDSDSVKIHKVHVQVVKDSSTAQNLFASGKIQETMMTGEYVKQDAQKYKNNMVFTKKGQTEFLNFSTKNKATSNKNFRLAFSYSLDRKQLTSKVLQDGSAPAKSMVPEGDGSNPKTGKDFNDDLSRKVAYNKQYAQQYWKKAQKQLGTNKVNVELLSSDGPNMKQVGEYIQSAVEKNLKGVKVSLVSIPQQQQLSRMFGGKYQITMLGWSTDFPDPSDFLNLMTKSNTVNFTHWSNPEYEKAMAKVNDTAKYSGEKRWNLMVDAGNISIQQQPSIPLYQITDAHLVSSKVGGLKYSLLTDSLYRYAYWK